MTLAKTFESIMGRPLPARPDNHTIVANLRRLADFIEAHGLTRDDLISAGYQCSHCELHLKPSSFRRLTEGREVRLNDVFAECDVEGVLLVSVFGEPTV